MSSNSSQKKVSGGIKRLGQKPKRSYFAPGTWKMALIKHTFFKTYAQERRSTKPPRYILSEAFSPAPICRFVIAQVYKGMSALGSLHSIPLNTGMWRQMHSVLQTSDLEKHQVMLEAPCVFQNYALLQVQKCPSFDGTRNLNIMFMPNLNCYTERRCSSIPNPGRIGPISVHRTHSCSWSESSTATGVPFSAKWKKVTRPICPVL